MMMDNPKVEQSLVGAPGPQGVVVPYYQEGVPWCMQT